MRLLTATLLCLAAGTARADLLYFAKGGRAELPATRDGKSIKVVSPKGVLVFEDSDFTAVVKRPTTAEDWTARKAKVEKGSADDRFAAAWWALENGLTEEAASLIRSVAKADPRHKLAGRLTACLDELDRELPKANVGSILGANPDRLQILEGKHAVLLYQGTEVKAKERLEVIERVVTTFLLWNIARGIELHPPKAKLVSIWYLSRPDYVAFLKRNDASAFENTGAYYHPTLNWVAGSDHSQTETVLKTRSDLEAKRAAIERYVEFIKLMPKGARANLSVPGERPRSMTKVQAEEFLRKETRDLARVELILDLEERSIDLGLTAHETVHQLIRNSGFAGHEKTLPSWLDEGLATQYEVVRGGRWAGVGRVNDQRITDWKSQKPEPRLAPVLRDEGFGRGYNRDLYARCWALTYYLTLKHPEKSTTFLDILRDPKPIPPHLQSSRVVQEFVKIFGDLPAAEADWHRFLRDLRTPLDEFDPNRKSSRDRR